MIETAFVLVQKIALTMPFYGALSDQKIDTEDVFASSLTGKLGTALDVKV